MVSKRDTMFSESFNSEYSMEFRTIFPIYEITEFISAIESVLNPMIHLLTPAIIFVFKRAQVF
jgi:hypothetical protein